MVDDNHSQPLNQIRAINGEIISDGDGVYELTRAGSFANRQRGDAQINIQDGIFVQSQYSGNANGNQLRGIRNEVRKGVQAALGHKQVSAIV